MVLLYMKYGKLFFMDLGDENFWVYKMLQYKLQ